MGVSLYYVAKRTIPLTEKEGNTIATIVTKYSETFAYKDEGELFCAYENDMSEPDIIFSGATKLPMTIGVEDMFIACLHWCECLTEIRRVVKNALWNVNVDDMSMIWDEDTGWFFPDEP